MPRIERWPGSYAERRFLQVWAEFKAIANSLLLTKIIEIMKIGVIEVGEISASYRTLSRSAPCTSQTYILPANTFATITSALSTTRHERFLRLTFCGCCAVIDGHAEHGR